jgi:hypothetical protein
MEKYYEKLLITQSLNIIHSNILSIMPTKKWNLVYVRFDLFNEVVREIGKSGQQNKPSVDA